MMTNGSKHYQAAEQLLDIAADMRHPSGYRRYCTETAMVHATLAQTAAIAAAFALGAPDADMDTEQWREILGLTAEQAIPAAEVTAEPLVTCGGTCGLEDCQLPVGHEQPASCQCGHGYLAHAGRDLAGAPRGVCLTSCGCLEYGTTPIPLARPYAPEGLIT